MRSTPRVTLPERTSSFRPGMLGSAALHLLAVLALLWGSTLAPPPDVETVGTPGEPAGGGGGGGGEIHYITLPPLGGPAALRDVVLQPERPVDVPLPTPRVREIPRTSPPLTLPTDAGALVGVDAPAGRTAGGGEGAGSGAGSGGGAGSGQGGGVGTGTGQGTGGEGGDAFPAEARQLVLVPGGAPSSVKGRDYTVTFTLDARGRIRRVDVEPPIADRDYRSKFMERMGEMRFYPARRLDGTPIESQFVMIITP